MGQLSMWLCPGECWAGPNVWKKCGPDDTFVVTQVSGVGGRQRLLGRGYYVESCLWCSSERPLLTLCSNTLPVFERNNLAHFKDTLNSATIKWGFHSAYWLILDRILGLLIRKWKFCKICQCSEKLSPNHFHSSLCFPVFVIISISH